MTQTTWEDEFDKRFNKDTLVSAHTDWTPKAIKDFISKTISQEKEKMIRIIEDNIPKPSPENPNVDEPYYRIINLLQNK